MIQNQKIAALYCRFSREEDNDGSGSNSIKNQIALLSSFARELNLGYEIYTDDGYSGTTFDRPDFQRMIHDIESRIIGTVIVKDLSRLGRNYSMTGYYTDEYFVSNQIRFISLTDHIDSAEKEDEFVPIRNIMNDWYARDISKKTKASLHLRGKSGLHMGSVPVYGYKVDEKDRTKWIIDEPAAAVVCRIYNLFLEGKGVASIAKLLTEEGIARPRIHKYGKKAKYDDWSRETVKGILTRQEYCGDTVNFKTSKPSYKSKKMIYLPVEERLIFPDTHPAIITRDQFEEVQTLLSKSRRQPTQKTKRVTLFRGLLVCSNCGGKLTSQLIRLKSGDKTSYTCSTYHNYPNQCTSHYVMEQAIVDRVVLAVNRLSEMYLSGSLTSVLKNTVLTDLNKEKILAGEELRRCNDRIAEIDTLIKSLYEDKVKGIVTPEVFLQLSADFTAEKEELRRSVYSLSVKAASKSDTGSKVNRFIQIIKKYSESSEAIDSLNRETLYDLIDHIVIGERVEKGKEDQRQIDIYFKHVGLIGNLYL